jgi:glycosyltransferase involved in cell wall biosynthesis
MQSRYVCAFRGRRDNYQVPLALAEADQLDQFITDLYCTEPLNRYGGLLPASAQERFAFRRQWGIPDERVRSLWSTTALEYTRHALGISHRQTYAKLDRDYSVAARDRARKTKSSLFLYSPYAWEAFTADYSHVPRRVLFQFHPHPNFERRVLAEDFETYPEMRKSHLEETRSTLGDFSPRERDCWKHADLIICASSFTKRTLVEAGADPNLCAVIPYGVDLPMLQEQEHLGGRVEALFVGSGIQRKGLHHLIRAWPAAKWPSGSRLTLVCRNIDPAMAEAVGTNDSIRLLSRVSDIELTALYQSSSLFVMPSLIEGFGQVFLEALAAGCPVLGTSNTCLPDLGGEEDGVFLTEPGDVDQLTARLEQFASSPDRLLAIRVPARRCAERFTWRRFRRNVITSLEHVVAAATSAPNLARS